MSNVDALNQTELRRLRSGLEAMVEHLGTQATLRQVLALVIIAQAEKAGRPIGVAGLDKELGDLSPGTSSKVVRQMLHVETPRKGDPANTLEAHRDAVDLRRWDIKPTTKGVDALASVINAMNGRQ
jgi:DNA-binding MarR family transcriptional regulator